MTAEGVVAPGAAARTASRLREAVRAFFGSALIELCWERGDGWAELCRAIGEPAPDEPFPHANRGRDKQRRKQRVLNAIARRLEALELRAQRQHHPGVRSAPCR